MVKHLFKKHIETVIPITIKEFDYILDHFTAITRRKNQYIVQEGELIDREFWVQKGCLRAYFYDQNDKEHIVQFAMENWWITDYEAFTKKIPAKFSVDCIEDSELLYITKSDKEKLCHEMPKMRTFWATKTKMGYIALQNRILSLIQNNARERYHLLLDQYPQLIQRVPKKMISSYLGVSRETLSRFK